jgi:hypothetical protein
VTAGCCLPGPHETHAPTSTSVGFFPRACSSRSGCSARNSRLGRPLSPSGRFSSGRLLRRHRSGPPRPTTDECFAHLAITSSPSIPSPLVERSSHDVDVDATVERCRHRTTGATRAAGPDSAGFTKDGHRSRGLVHGVRFSFGLARFESSSPDVVAVVATLQKRAAGSSGLSSRSDRAMGSARETALAVDPCQARRGLEVRVVEPCLPRRVAGHPASRRICPSQNQSRARARSDHAFESNGRHCRITP